MQRAPLSVLLATALLCAVAAPARAHLVPSGADTLLGMLAAADGVLVARSAAATTVRDDGSAATPFLAREAIAGTGPTGGFVLDQEAPPLRYAELQDALLLVVRRPGSGTTQRWFSVQPAGAAILVDGGDVDERTRDVLRRLWAVAHPPAPEAKDGDHGTAALIDALSLSNKKLRALAFLDLSALAASPEHFSKVQTSRLATYGDQPDDDAELAPAVRELGKKLGGAPMKQARVTRDQAHA